MTSPSDNLPFVYSGSMIVQGNGIASVTATGLNTEIGKIGKALDKVQQEPTRLKMELGSLVRKLAIIGTLLCVLVIVVYTLTRGELLKGFLAGITLAMAMLPRIPCGADDILGARSVAHVKKKCADTEACGG